MRTLKFLSTLLLFTTLSYTYAQSEHESNSIELPDNNHVHLLKIKPLNILLGQYGLDYEIGIHPQLSLNFNSDIVFIKFNRVLDGENVGDGFQIEGGIDLRYYFLKKQKAPAGLYIAAGAIANYTSAEIENSLDMEVGNNKNITAYGASLFTGYQWILKSNINIGLSAGAKYLTIPTEDEDIDEWRPTFEFSIGYSW